MKRSPVLVSIALCVFSGCGFNLNRVVGLAEILGPPHPALITVDGAGIGNSTYQRDGTHLIFVDNTPGKNANLVLFREGEGTNQLGAYVSTDNGVNWTKYTLPTTGGILNGMGGVQDSVNHKFHIAWTDAGVGSKYSRWIPSYTGGDITGFTNDTIYDFYNGAVDSPGPREVTEVIDISGNHRLLAVVTDSPGSGGGDYRIGISTVTTGTNPASIADWAKVTDQTATSSSDPLLPGGYPTAETTATYMLAMSSNLVSGAGSSVVVVAGLPTDRNLLSWTLTPVALNNFTISAIQTRSSSFGTGVLAGASLSEFNMPSGRAVFLYSEGPGAASPGLHVAAFDANGSWVSDAYPQPTTSTAAVHGVIAAGVSSRPAVLYSDGAGSVLGSYYLGAWSAPTVVATYPTPISAWNISNPWTVGGHETFGIYMDAGSGSPTDFASVSWY